MRLSGLRSLAVASTVFQSSTTILADRRGCYEGQAALPGVAAPLPADLYSWPAPKTYTGQEMVEIHTVSSPPLVNLLIAACLQKGARAAQPGEFTMRAFLAGKLDLTRAEAVLGVTEAGNRDELQQALAQLAGGVARPLQQLREDLLNLLADVEAGLDFAEEDVHFVATDDMLHRLASALAQVTLVQKQLAQRSTGPRPFRVVLCGKTNAGKSSLFNALAGKAVALVSAQPGTTRDYLVQRLNCDGLIIELVDTAGWRPGRNGADQTAQALGREQAELADLLLLCLEAGQGVEPSLGTTPAATPPVLAIATKCDLAQGPAGLLATSAITQQGLAQLRTFLAERARAHARPALAPSLSRCHHHVAACLQNLRRAHAIVLHEEPLEILALELRETLEELGAMVGTVYTDDLLDRIFSRFCIGK